MIVPHRRLAGIERLPGLDDRRQHLVIDLHQLGGVARLGGGVGDDNRHRVADMPHPVARQGRSRRHRHFRAVAIGDRAHARDRADAIARQILAGENANDTRSRYGRRGLDRSDPGMRMRRAQHRQMGLTRPDNVVEIAAASGQEPPVFGASDRLSNAELRHRGFLALGYRFNIGSGDAGVQ